MALAVLFQGTVGQFKCQIRRVLGTVRVQRKRSRDDQDDEEKPAKPKKRSRNSE